MTDIPAAINTARKHALAPESALLLALQRRTVTRRQLQQAHASYQLAADTLAPFITPRP